MAEGHTTTVHPLWNEQSSLFSAEETPARTAKNKNYKNIKRAANTRKGAKIMMIITSSSAF